MKVKTLMLSLALGVCATLQLQAGPGEWVWGYAWTDLDQYANKNYDYCVYLTSTNEYGEACLDPESLLKQGIAQGKMTAGTGWPCVIEFVEGRDDPKVIEIATIDFDRGHGQGNDWTEPITFKVQEDKEGLILKTRGKDSVFCYQQHGVEGKSQLTGVTFENLTIEGTGDINSDLYDLPYDGGAICAVDISKMTVKNCTFTNLVTRFTGGAISASCIKDQLLVANCTFLGNSSHPINGNGGAIYASRHIDCPNATFKILGSKFVGNSAENGGAISTLTVISDDEKPIDLYFQTYHNDLGDDAYAHCLFENNTAVYEGGAILAEGSIFTKNTTDMSSRDKSAVAPAFRSNHAGLAGGAICMQGIVGDYVPSMCQIYAGEFTANSVSSETNWVAGGAIAVMPAECELVVGTEKINGGENTSNVVFMSNTATSKGMQALGGAVYSAKGATNSFYRTRFEGNIAKDTAGKWCYGDAISVAGGKTTVDVSVFLCTNTTAKSFGNAIDFNETEASLLNSTFRGGQVEAVSAYLGSLTITNCVLVGNNLSGGAGDVYYEGEAKLDMEYSAYGTMMIDKDNVAVTLGSHNLSNQTAALVYKSQEVDSGYLRDWGFNPVAALGLQQKAKKDHERVTYGSKALGTSMGAYETPTTNLTVVLDGSRRFKKDDVSSNGCVWTWNSYTNITADTYDLVDWPKDNFGPLDQAYTITNWAFSSAAAGYYASTNASATVTAGVTSRTDRVEWLSPVVSFIYTGTIEQNTNKVWVVIVPDEYKWTGDAVIPGDESDPKGEIIVSNTVEDIVLEPSEYSVVVTGNVDPTNAAVVTVTGTNNYEFTETATFFITAYVTKIYTNVNCLVKSDMYGSLSGTNEFIEGAMESPIPGYCLDYQNSMTNKTVARYNPGGDDSKDNEAKVTTLYAIYEIDANGDGVPDKYQKKLVLATVNGEWNASSNAMDRLAYATMTNNTGVVYTNANGSTEGVWTTDKTLGVCTLAADSPLLPAVGERPLNGFDTTGTWLTAAGDPLVSSEISWGSFPIYYYLYKQSNAPRTGDDKGSYSTMADGELEAAVQITDFALGEEGEIGGALEAQLRSAATGVTRCSAVAANSKIEVWGAETLDGEWFKVGEATTDADGIWTVSRMRTSRALSATRTTNADRTSSWSVSGVAEPKFFRVNLVEE